MEYNKSSFFARRSTGKRTGSRLLIIVIFILFTATGCNQGNYITVKHVKPVNRNRYYKKNKDKKKKRVKYVKMKILKRSPQTASAPKQKKMKPKNQMAPPAKTDTVQYESDSTGFIP